MGPYQRLRHATPRGSSTLCYHPHPAMHAAGADFPAGDAAGPLQARHAARKALLARLLLADAGGAAGGAPDDDDNRLEAVLRAAEARAAAAGAGAAAHARACAALGFDTTAYAAAQQLEWGDMLLLLHSDKIQGAQARAEASQRLTALELRVAASLCALVTRLMGEHNDAQQAIAADAARAEREAAAERAAAAAAAAADAADASFAPGASGAQAELARPGYGCAAGGTRSRKALQEKLRGCVFEVSFDRVSARELSMEGRTWRDEGGDDAAVIVSCGGDAAVRSAAKRAAAYGDKASCDGGVSAYRRRWDFSTPP